MQWGRTLRATTAAALTVVSGCGGGDGNVVPDEITKMPETDNQTAPAEARVPLPLAVTVRGSDGSALPRIKVRWRIDPGSGALSDSITLSDAMGRAQVDYAVGRAVGPYSVRAEIVVNADRSTTFTATATAAPTLTSVSPNQFTGGDVVTVQGTGLAASALFEVNGAPARVTTGSATSLTVVIPVCLAPGQATLRARVNGGFSNVINGTYASSMGPLKLDVGEYASIDPERLAGCATFPAAGLLGAEYLVAPQSATGAPGVSAVYRLTGDAATIAVAPAPRVEDPLTPARLFHEFLRGREVELGRLPHAARGDAPPAALAAPAAGVKVGDQREFRVCNKLNCTQIPDFSKIQSKAKFVGAHVAIFQDNDVPPSGFTDDEFATLGQTFENVLYDVNTRAFGVESDVDENGLVFVLLTPVVNRLTAKEQCSTSVVTGFFYAIDIDPAFAADQRANQAEVFYALVPDPQGTVTCTLAKDRIRQVVPTTFIHEFQHMISYNQHVLLRARAAEAIWLNEAMSHLAEELGGLRFRDLGQQATFSEFVIGDVFNAYQYLKTPGSHFMAFDDGAGTLSERGATWLFLRWLVDKFGTDLTRRLSETPLTGQENVASAVGEPISRLLAQWFLANYVSDLPNFTPPSRLKYESWNFRTTYASLNQQQPQRFDRPFPLVPQAVNGGGFTADGTLRSGSGDYFRVMQGPSQGAFTLRLIDPSGGPVSSNVLARLNVIRIK
ncbi:MAG: IPT/TIG domain-containing protein [Gemmatimonadetes bacterium]|nr:IPT/TIG domain-containing protein [Gemmatimonadota bacterium]